MDERKRPGLALNPDLLASDAEARGPASPAELRSFGIGLAVVLAIAAFFKWRHGHPPSAWLVIAGLVAAVGIMKPRTLAPIFGPWMAIVRVLAVINLYVWSAVLYYGVVTPYGLLYRLVGKDPLDRKLGTADSYWHKREPRTDPADYERQF